MNNIKINPREIGYEGRTGFHFVDSEHFNSFTGVNLLMTYDV
jgi:hypothetical protein